MNVLILAAGFGTRMGSLSLTTAKPLLPVAGRPVAEHLCDKLIATGKTASLNIVTNQYYYDQFHEWMAGYGHEIKLMNDGATSNENRLGAISDLDFALDEIGRDEPLMVLAGDNLFDFDFLDMISFFEDKNTDVVAARKERDLHKLRKTGVASVDGAGRLVLFQEKPARPESDYAVPCIYIFTPPTLALVKDYLASGENTDAPGHFISWLYRHTPVHAFRFDSSIYSIGDVDSYESTRNLYGKGK